MLELTNKRLLLDRVLPLKSWAKERNRWFMDLDQEITNKMPPKT
jgi:hypothetical protein